MSCLPFICFPCFVADAFGTLTPGLKLHGASGTLTPGLVADVDGTLNPSLTLVMPTGLKPSVLRSAFMILFYIHAIMPHIHHDHAIIHLCII
jgi:hypothetical protein